MVVLGFGGSVDFLGCPFWEMESLAPRTGTVWVAGPAVASELQARELSLRAESGPTVALSAEDLGFSGMLSGLPLIRRA